MPEETPEPQPGPGESAVPVSAVPAEAVPASEAPARRPRVRRRVTTEAVPGTDPNPLPEPTRHASTENDDRLQADKPPHWG